MNSLPLDRRHVLLGMASMGLAARAGASSLSPSADIPDLPRAVPEAVGMSTPGLARIQAVMADYIARSSIDGGVTVVARRNRLVHLQAHGLMDERAKVGMRLDAEFRMASSTKPITGVALLQQIEAGKVSLDDPISKFIPELKRVRGVAKQGVPRSSSGVDYRDDQIDPQSREITIRDLATHTSGLNGMGLPYRPDETLASYIPRLNAMVLDFQPGTQWGYSPSVGPDVLARVVEITSGQPYDQYLRQHIFDPIGMIDTRHNLLLQQRARIVQRYERQDGAFIPAREERRPDTYFPGAWGLYSTARDAVQFETMLLNRGIIHGNRVLKPESVELMRTNLVGDLYRGIARDLSGMGFGILVSVVTDPAEAHSSRSRSAFGWSGAYGTMSWTDPTEQLVAAIMIQQRVPALQNDFQAAVRAAIIA